MATPRFATKRNKRRKSFIDEITAVADMLGYDLMAWQSELFAVSTEYRVSTGEFYYPTSVCTVPRQAGKSVMAKVLTAWRCMSRPDQTVLYIAQTRGHAAKHIESLAKDLNRAGVEGFRYTRGVGQEMIRWDNGSTAYVESPNASGGHGASTSLVVIDEAFTLEPYTAQGIIPTLLAEATSQLWIISTQGTEDSEAWNGFVERGREAVSDPKAEIAYLEYAADVDAGDDVLDPEHWGRWMPSLGVTITERSMRLAIENTLTAEGPHGVLRAYGNIVTATDSELFPADWLERGLDAYQSPPERGVVFAFDVNWDPKASSIAAAWETDGGWHSEIVAREAGMGSEWLLGELKRLVVKHRPVALASVGGTSAREIQGQIKALAEQYVIPYRVLPNQDYAAACQGFYEGLRTGTVTFGDNESLDNALRRVVVKDTGELWRFDSKASRVDVSPLVACADALFVAREVAARRMQVAIY